jgi:spermidine synthase
MTSRRHSSFLVALYLLCAGTMMYEIVLTRLLSAVCWYYLAFVSISAAMFGMTAGALAVQLRPVFFDRRSVGRRLVQGSFAMALSLPLSLLAMLAVPVDISLAVETLFSFLFFSAIIAVPFFFSGVVVCLSLTKVDLPVGRIYFSDLAGAATGCLTSVVLLTLIDAPSAIFAISAILFVSTIAYSIFEGGEAQWRKRAQWFALAMIAVAGVNSLSVHGIQPIWSKGRIDRRARLLTEIWNPISKVRAIVPQYVTPEMRGPSSRLPEDTKREEILLDIDNDADTAIMHFRGDLAEFDYLRYDVTSLGAQLRKGGTAAIIGVGGGRDVINCATNGFQRIVGIEVNPTIVQLTTKRFLGFSGFDKIPNFELHNDEGRSYLTRSAEKFDLIQASLVDTYAASAAGAMTLVENSLYTVDGWRVFYEHLRPGGIITFSRWNFGPEASQTYRLFAVAWGMLLSEGVQDPSSHMALLATNRVATLLTSNQSYSEADLNRFRQIADDMDFKILYLPGSASVPAELREIVATRSLAQLAHLQGDGVTDNSPVFDSSPYFFNSVPLERVPRLVLRGGRGANLRALMFVFAFMLSAIILTYLTIILPARHWSKAESIGPPAGAIAYFIVIGLGFMLVEMGMMQQLSIFLGHPIYSLVVVLAGLVLFTGLGSFVSDRLQLNSSQVVRVPPILTAVAVGLYSFVVIPVIHHFVAGVLLERALISLLLVAPCGFFMGFCFPLGLRWMSGQQQTKNLPWMWALNGAASTLGSFVAILVSMSTSITACVLTGACLYLMAAFSLPQRAPANTATP